MVEVSTYTAYDGTRHRTTAITDEQYATLARMKKQYKYVNAYFAILPGGDVIVIADLGEKGFDGIVADGSIIAWGLVLDRDIH